MCRSAYYTLTVSSSPSLPRSYDDGCTRIALCQSCDERIDVEFHVGGDIDFETLFPTDYVDAVMDTREWSVDGRRVVTFEAVIDGRWQRTAAVVGEHTVTLTVRQSFDGRLTPDQLHAALEEAIAGVRITRSTDWPCPADPPGSLLSGTPVLTEQDSIGRRSFTETIRTTPAGAQTRIWIESTETCWR